mgnify:CR=1 FL=1
MSLNIIIKQLIKAISTKQYNIAKQIAIIYKHIKQITITI